MKKFIYIFMLFSLPLSAQWNAVYNGKTMVHNGKVLRIHPDDIPQSPSDQCANELGIPSYDPENSEHWLIDSDSDFDSINSTVKRLFYVKPGEYSKVTITADGTSGSKRYLSLYGSCDTHPAKLDTAYQADVDLVFDSAQHWVVDRLSNYSSTSDYAIEVTNTSKNILFNRLHLTDFQYAIILKGSISQSDYMDSITIQNCRIGPQDSAARDADKVAIILTGKNWNWDRTIHNTQILNNEIFNCNDGIMLNQHETEPNHRDAAGTVISGNHVFITPAIYSNGSGVQDSTGLYAWAENAMDIKFGSADSTMPIVFKNNYLWGYRKTDANGGGSGSNGAAIVVHFGADNLVFHDNVIFNSNRALTFSNSDSVRIYENIFKNIGYDPEESTEYAVFGYGSEDIEFADNIVRDSSNTMSRWYAFNNDETDVSIAGNVLIYSYMMGGTIPGSATISDNWFYATTRRSESDGTYYSNASDANMTDLTFETDNYTNNAREITLTGVVTTESSPHYGQ